MVYTGKYCVPMIIYCLIDGHSPVYNKVNGLVAEDEGSPIRISIEQGVKNYLYFKKRKKVY